MLDRSDLLWRDDDPTPATKPARDDHVKDDRARQDARDRQDEAVLTRARDARANDPQTRTTGHRREHAARAHDPEARHRARRSRTARTRLAERFKAPHDDLRLVIVCEMWLTDFDCPPAHTMYLDKPLAGHNLMQAIARVNRVYGDKPGGLIVDLLGLADQLADALATYTQAGGTGEAVRKVQNEAVPAMQAAFEKLRGFFHSCDYEQALDAKP